MLNGRDRFTTPNRCCPFTIASFLAAQILLHCGAIPCGSDFTKAEPQESQRHHNDLRACLNHPQPRTTSRHIRCYYKKVRVRKPDHLGKIALEERGAMLYKGEWEQEGQGSLCQLWLSNQRFITSTCKTSKDTITKQPNMPEIRFQRLYHHHTNTSRTSDIDHSSHKTSATTYLSQIVKSALLLLRLAHHPVAGSIHEHCPHKMVN